MNSVDKLREYAGSFPGGMGGDALRHYADEIEREIERDYMRLPVDADGVPIHVGDELKTAHGSKVVIEYVGECEVGVYRDGKHYRISQDEYAYTCRHVKPRTLEDVLYECFHDCMYKYPFGIEPIISKYADELRSMEVGE